MNRNKKTKPDQSASKKLFDSDAYLDVFDVALTSTGEELKKLLPMLKPSEISEAFATYVHTHLSTELSNIAAHGHRNDDPEMVLQARPDVLAALKQAASVLDLWLNGPGDADGEETDAALMVANAAILAADAGHRANDPEDKQTPKKLDGILIEVNGGVVSYVQFEGKPVTAYHLFDWDELLGDSDTRLAWEGLSTEEQEFIRGRYPTEFAAIQERLMEEAESE
jgi:hypothetical protein